MELNVNRKSLINIFTNAKRITRKKTTLAITSTALLIAKNNKIKIQASNLDTWFEDEIQADVISEGEIAIPVTEFLNFIKTLDNEIINLKMEETQWLEISAKSSNFNLVCMNPEDFPAIQDLNDISMMEIDQHELAEAFRKSSVSVDLNSNKPYHKVVCIKQKDNILQFVSTDGDRLTYFESKIDSDIFKTDENILVQYEGFAEIYNLIKGKKKVKKGFINNKVFIGINNQYFVFKKDHLMIVVRRIEADYPDYYDLIDEVLNRDKFKTDMIVDKIHLINLLKKAKSMQGDFYKGMTVKLEKNKLTALFTNPDFGEMKDELKVNYDGDEIELILNPALLLNIINVVDSNFIKLSFKAKDQPVGILGDKDKGFVGLIMPMRD